LTLLVRTWENISPRTTVMDAFMVLDRAISSASVQFAFPLDSLAASTLLTDDIDILRDYACAVVFRNFFQESEMVLSPKFTTKDRTVT
jgi:hypothetical protein